MWTRPPYRRTWVGAAVILLALLNACGGGGGGTTSTPVTTPPPPPQVVSQGVGMVLEADSDGRVVFTTTRAGSLQATVDWSFATNDVDVALVAGDCPIGRFVEGLCTVLCFSDSVTAKPESVHVDGVGPGTYTLFVGNAGPEREVISFQVVLTPSATGVVATEAVGRHAGFALTVQPRGYVEW